MLGVAVFVALAVLLLATAILMWLNVGRQRRHQQVDWQARIRGESGPSIAPMNPGGLDSEDPILSWLDQRFLRAGLSLDMARLRKLALGLLLLPVLFFFVGGMGAALISLMVQCLAVYAWLLRRETLRRRMILNQLPDFIEHMMRSLSAGNSIEESMYSAAQDADEPIRGLFSAVGRQVRLGAPLDEVLDQSAAVHDLRDLRVMAMAARVNRRYGGSLKRIFKSLIQAIRERDAATRELRALTAETRVSAFVLAAVPIVLMLYILLQNPQYYQEMWAEDFGRRLLLLSVFLQSMGVTVIWRMLNIAEDQG